MGSDARLKGTEKEQRNSPIRFSLNTVDTQESYQEKGRESHGLPKRFSQLTAVQPIRKRGAVITSILRSGK
jgi:hypothetical protein